MVFEKLSSRTVAILAVLFLVFFPNSESVHAQPIPTGVSCGAVLPPVGFVWGQDGDATHPDGHPGRPGELTQMVEPVEMGLQMAMAGGVGMLVGAGTVEKVVTVAERGEVEMALG